MPESALASLELAAARNPAGAMELLLVTVRRMAAGTSLEELATPEAPQPVEVLATRLAAAMARILPILPLRLMTVSRCAWRPLAAFWITYMP